MCKACGFRTFGVGGKLIILKNHYTALVLD